MLSLHAARPICAVRRDVDVVLEALSLFVRYQLTVTALLPEADSAARAVGNERFERFIAQLGRQIVGGKRTLTDRKSTRLTPVTNAHLVCRLLLEKKNKTTIPINYTSTIPSPHTCTC